MVCLLPSLVSPSPEQVIGDFWGVWRDERDEMGGNGGGSACLWNHRGRLANRQRTKCEPAEKMK